MIMFLTLTFSFVSCTASCLLTYSYLDGHKFEEASCSTSTYTDAMSSVEDFSLLQKMTLQVEEIVRMLLLLAGVESHPGPTSYKAYLLQEPITLESLTSPLPSLVCSDGTMNPMCTMVLKKSSSWFDEIVPSMESSCTNCLKVIRVNTSILVHLQVVHLPDFTTRTVSLLVLLLTKGEANLERGELEEIRNFQRVIGCPGVTRQELVYLDPGECPHCFRYILFVWLFLFVCF